MDQISNTSKSAAEELASEISHNPCHKLALNFFTTENRYYIEEVESKINAVKEEFLKSCKETDKTIEEEFRKVGLCVYFRQKALKRRLREIEKAKVMAWDQQLCICKAALCYLNKIDDVSNDYQMIQSFCHAVQLSKRNIDLLHAGEIAFEVENSINSVLQDIGRITFSGTLMNNPEIVIPRVLPKFVIGVSGNKVTEFCRPWGVCSDPSGRIIVSDRRNNRIQIFSESGRFLFKFGKEGAALGEFNRPAGVTADKQCKIIVADKDNHRIQVFTSLGCFLFTFGKRGTKNGEFIYPWDVAVNSDCNIAVSDFKNRRIQLFDSQGNFLTKFAELSLKCPRGLAFQSDGRLFVTDFDNHRLVIIDKNFKTMKPFGKEGDGAGEFFRPQGIACDESGRFAVADCKNYRIQVFDKAGNVSKIFGNKGAGPGQLDCPQGICFHPNGNIIVVDFGNDRVQVF